MCGAALAVIAGCAGDTGDFHTYSDPVALQSGRNPDEGSEQPDTPAADPGELQEPATGIAEDTVATDEEVVDQVAQDVVSINPDLTAPGTIADFAQAVARDPEAALLAAAQVAETLPNLPTQPREIEVLVPENQFREEGPQGAVRVSYNDLDLLKTLNMDPVIADAPDYFPEWLKGLEGQRIRLRGYMRPGPLSKDIPFFVLARDTNACCFGPNTRAYDIIPTLMRQGVTTDYIHLRPFDVVGVFHVNVEMDLDDESKVEFLYFIDDAVVIEN